MLNVEGGQQVRKKILLIHHSGLIGGGSLSLLDVWRVLEQRNDVVALIPQEPPNLSMLLQAQGRDFLTFRGRLPKIPFYSGGERLWHPRFWFYVVSILFQWRKWRRLIFSMDPDFVIVNSGVLAWLSLLLGEMPSACFVRETAVRGGQGLWNAILRNLRDRFSLVVFLSEYDKRRARQKSATALVIRDVADSGEGCVAFSKQDACQRLNVPHETLNILLPGGVNKLKGFDLAVEGLSQLPSQYHLIVAGDSGDAGSRGIDWILRSSRRYRRRAARKVFKLGLVDRVHYLGVVEDMNCAYSASDLVLLPLREGHQSRPAFEAGFQRKPVVISSFPNLAECVFDGVNALTFSPGNNGEMVRAIKLLTTSRKLRQEVVLGNYGHAYSVHVRGNSDCELLDAVDEHFRSGR